MTIKNYGTLEKKKLKEFYGFASKLAKEISVLGGVLGGLSLLKFNALKEVLEGLKDAKDGGQAVFDYLNVANRTAGVSSSNVIQDITKLQEDRRKSLATGQQNVAMSLIGASSAEEVDVILTKYRQVMSGLSKEKQEIYNERLGFSKDMLRIARLSDEEFQQTAKLGFLNKENIKKIEETARITKATLGQLSETKDQMIVSFSPFVISTLTSIQDFLRSKYMEELIKSTGGLAKDITDFNETLDGVPLKALMALIVAKMALDHKELALLAGAATIGQDLYHGVRELMGDKMAKKNVTAGIIRGGLSPWNVEYAKDAGKNALERANAIKNWFGFGNSTTSNNSNIVNNNTTINVNVNDRNRKEAKDIANEIGKVIDAKNYNRLSILEK